MARAPPSALVAAALALAFASGRASRGGGMADHDSKPPVFGSDGKPPLGRLYEKGGRSYVGPEKRGLPHGVGKSYFGHGQLQYEGQWVAGLWHGQGKLYHQSGQLYYVGDFLNGEPQGHGKSYSVDGKLEYEGEWDHGLRTRKGMSWFPNGNPAYAYWNGFLGKPAGQGK